MSQRDRAALGSVQQDLRVERLPICVIAVGWAKSRETRVHEPPSSRQKFREKLKKVIFPLHLDMKH